LHVSALWQVAADVGIDSFSFEATPDALDEQHGEPWAHCVATEINRIAYDSNPAAKMRIKDWALAVANGITDQDVFGPYESPSGDDDYRPATSLE
jgi:hypothetical protein